LPSHWKILITENYNNSSQQLPSKLPLVVDLDGTLIHTDLLHESALGLVRSAPLHFFALPIWLLRGRAYLKHRIAEHVELDVTTLPFNQALIDWLKVQQHSRSLILCTASDRKYANAVADHLGLFDEVMASDGTVNLAGKSKADALVARFGEKGFDYVGNSRDDLQVWVRSMSGVVVNGSAALCKQAAAVTTVETVMPKPPASVKTWIKVFRLHQWIKNTLLFVPIFTAHLKFTGALESSLGLAFLAFGLCASSVYISNDLLDLESDRLHPRKRFRPFASGAVPIWQGVLIAPLLLMISLLVAATVGSPFLACLALYFALTCAYSLLLKRLVLVDCLTLAALYTMRIIAGGQAAGVPVSFWLLALSIFLFLSLAFIKRYAELRLQQINAIDKSHGRGYLTSDADLIQQFGVTAGYAATLVLALYLNSENVLVLYRTPEMIWCAVPLLLLWLSRMWFKAHRGLMHDDPIIFAIKDKTSVLIGILFLATFVLAGSR
jgi:4-hydroxybenzoate polyprenyltransferase